nr:hypothetical protein [Tanacetum cinerariifolium]
MDVSNRQNWLIHQLAVKNAFLIGDLSKTVYMYQPPSFVDARFGFSLRHCDSSLFIYRHGSKDENLLIYVDDIVLMASSTYLLHRIISSLYKEFDMIDLGALNYFLGISVTRDFIDMFLCHKKYAWDLFDRAHMAICNPTRTSVDTESKLRYDWDHISDPTLHRSLASLKRVLSYVCGALEIMLQLYASATDSLGAYFEVDWAGCHTIRRSTSSYCVFFEDNLLSWSSKRQHTLFRSSAEAEYEVLLMMLLKLPGFVIFSESFIHHYDLQLFSIVTMLVLYI